MGQRLQEGTIDPDTLWLAGLLDVFARTERLAHLRCDDDATLAVRARLACPAMHSVAACTEQQQASLS